MLDQIGVGFKDGKQLLRVGNRLALQHAAAGLVDHLLSQLAIVLNLLAQGLQLGGLEDIRHTGILALVQHRAGAVHDLLGDLD